MKSNKAKGRLAGFVYLLVVVFGIGAQVVRSSLFIEGDIVATAQNLAQSPFLFRLSFISDMVMMTSFLFLPLALYNLLKGVSKTWAQLMVIFVVVSIPIHMLNLLNYFSAFYMLSGVDYLSVLGTEVLQAQALLSYEKYLFGYHIAQVFFGLWLLPLGVLVYKSDFFPRFLGILLVASCVGHLIEVFVLFLFPEYKFITYPGLIVATIGELGFCLWLLILGARDKQVASMQV